MNQPVELSSWIPALLNQRFQRFRIDLDQMAGRGRRFSNRERWLTSGLPTPRELASSVDCCGFTGEVFEEMAKRPNRAVVAPKPMALFSHLGLGMC